MQKVRILRTESVAVDGIHIKLFKKGHELTLDKYIAEKLVKIKVAEFIRTRARVAPEEPVIIAPTEKAVIESAPEKKEGIKPELEAEAMRVHEMAKKFSMPSRGILNAAKKLGINANAPANKLSGKEVDKIKKYLGI